MTCFTSPRPNKFGLRPLLTPTQQLDLWGWSWVFLELTDLASLLPTSPSQMFFWMRAELERSNSRSRRILILVGIHLLLHLVIGPVFFLDLSVGRIFRMLPLLFLESGQTWCNSLGDLELVSVTYFHLWSESYFFPSGHTHHHHRVKALAVPFTLIWAFEIDLAVSPKDLGSSSTGLQRPILLTDPNILHHHFQHLSTSMARLQPLWLVFNLYDSFSTSMAHFHPPPPVFNFYSSFSIFTACFQHTLPIFNIYPSYITCKQCKNFE